MLSEIARNPPLLRYINYLLPVNLYYMTWSISSGQITCTHQVPCADHGYGYGVVCLYIICHHRWSAIAVKFFSVQSCVYRDIGGVDDDRNDAIRAGLVCVCEAIGYKCASERWSFDAETALARGFYTRGSYGCRSALPPVVRSRHHDRGYVTCGEITSGCARPSTV